MGVDKRKQGIVSFPKLFYKSNPEKCDLTHHIIYVVLNLNLLGIRSESGASKNRNPLFSLVDTHFISNRILLLNITSLFFHLRIKLLDGNYTIHKVIYTFYRQ